MKLHPMSIVLGLAFLSACAKTPAPPPQQPELLPAKGFVIDWKADLPLDTKVDRLYVADDYVFAYTVKNEVEQFNRQKGVPVFAGEPLLQGSVANPRVLFPPVVLREWVVFPTEEALSVYDRKGNWSHQLPLRETMRGPATGDGASKIYFAISNGRIVEVRPEKQPGPAFALSEAMAQDGRGFNGSPFYFQNAVYIASRQGLVHAAAANDLRVALWTAHRETDHGFPTHGQVLSDVKVDPSGVFVTSTDGQLYCLDINTGKIRWSYYAQAPLRRDNSPILAQEMLYLPVRGKGFLAFEKNLPDGPIRSPKWTLDAKQFLAQDDQGAYFLGNDGLIWAIDKKTGQVKYKSRRNDFRLFATNLKDGTIYAISESGQLYAITSIKPPKPGVKPEKGLLAMAGG